MKLPKLAVGGSLIVFVVAVAALLLMAAVEDRDPRPSAPAPVADAPVDEEPAAVEPERRPPPTFTAEEVARHDHVDDCWLIIRGRVYDVTEYIPRHPAPLRTITDYCGGESTEAFETKEHLERDHRRSSYRLLENYFVGVLETEE